MDFSLFSHRDVHHKDNRRDGHSSPVGLSASVRPTQSVSSILGINDQWRVSVICLFSLHRHAHHKNNRRDENGAPGGNHPALLRLSSSSSPVGLSTSVAPPKVCLLFLVL